MVGYILGLGDRHVQNILVDQTAAELIHIDLGVAFEQGRILPTPETIPFRLTRDIVDGMGVTGVEGVFRKSCEMTLEVLRNNSEIILNILEVLLYDPLYMWTLTADRKRKVQPADSNKATTASTKRNSSVPDTPADEAPKERNNSAARVLLRLRQKLSGVEEGGSSASALSVPGHVSLLVQRAMDPERLNRLFPGWQPYL